MHHARLRLHATHQLQYSLAVYIRDDVPPAAIVASCERRCHGQRPGRVMDHPEASTARGAAAAVAGSAGARGLSYLSGARREAHFYYVEFASQGCCPAAVLTRVRHHSVDLRLF